MTPAEASAHYRPGGGFRNPWVSQAVPGFGSLLKWMLVHRTTRPRPADPDASMFARVAPSFKTPRADANQLLITWVGHSSLLIQIGGMNVLADPMWSERASPVGFAGPKRWVAPAISFDHLPPIDVVLQSHNHYDHLDDATVRRLARAHPNATWVFPLKLGAFARTRGVRGEILELDWWQERVVGSLRIAATPAMHFSSRTIGDRGDTLWCGYAIAGTDRGRGVYFAGDTGFHPEFPAIGERYGPFDVALLPIGAYEPRWFMRYLHMNPEEAVDAFRLVNARAMLPIHWGTFKLTDEAMDEPPRRARDAWLAAGLPIANYRQLAHGETLTL